MRFSDYRGSYIGCNPDAVGKCAEARISELEGALRMVMMGGNHLPPLIGVDHPRYGTPHDEAREFYYKSAGWPGNYEAWCCWNAIMLARDVLENGGEHGSTVR